MIAQGGGLDWRNVTGNRSRQLLRHLDHTEAVHGFLAALAEQAREQGWELTQLDPPQRASRYFRFDGKLYSVQPDAFGILCMEGRDQPFFLEWERRAIRPSTMTRRLAPYLRYYRSQWPSGGLRRRHSCSLSSTMTWRPITSCESPARKRSSLVSSYLYSCQFNPSWSSSALWVDFGEECTTGNGDLRSQRAARPSSGLATQGAIDAANSAKKTIVGQLRKSSGRRVVGPIIRVRVCRRVFAQHTPT